jgi:hypothetical protein
MVPYWLNCKQLQPGGYPHCYRVEWGLEKLGGWNVCEICASPRISHAHRICLISRAGWHQRKVHPLRKHTWGTHAHRKRERTRTDIQISYEESEWVNKQNALMVEWGSRSGKIKERHFRGRRAVSSGRSLTFLRNLLITSSGSKIKPSSNSNKQAEKGYFNIAACRHVARQRPRNKQLYNNRYYAAAHKQQ